MTDETTGADDKRRLTDDGREDRGKDDGRLTTDDRSEEHGAMG